MLLKIRCSQLSKIMTLPRAIKDQGKLSVGAKTYLDQLAKEYVFNYTPEISSKYIEKGNECENDSIMLLNDLMLERGEFIEYSKNDKRYENDFLTGEMDIISEFEELTRDTKTSWNLDSFPASIESALAQTNASDYEWQGRGYMMLLNEHDIKIDRHSVDYCLVDTPLHLIGSFDNSLHEFSHYPTSLRVTSVIYERCLEKESFIKERCKLAQIYYAEAINRIYQDHGMKPLKAA